MTIGDGRNPNDPNIARDLTRGVSAWMFWYLPIALLVVGAQWRSGGAWLWVVAFVVMGAGCLTNAARCGRTHCYVTGPLFLLAAVWVLLSAWRVVPLHAFIMLPVVFGIAALAYLVEVPLGRYRFVKR